MMELIEFKNVSKHYNGKFAVEDFSLEIKPGERLVILGPSGCGKTTVLRMLAGFVVPDSGSIRLDGDLIASNGQSLKEPEERNIGMVFQDLALWPHLTVRGNLEFGLKARGIGKQEREKRMTEILRLVGMEHAIGARPAELSGGEQQRIAIARALVLHPGILLMDEPLSSLNYELNYTLRREIQRFHEQIGFTLVYVTHNLEEAFDIATHVVAMKNGRIDRSGVPKEFKEHFNRLCRNMDLKKEELA
jgi:ABC-type Fe3+/spermidine/putrescine transport system ATPase subunit